ncbi:MAG: 6-bladed beta-propeller [Longimicrobiales bacterium]
MIERHTDMLQEYQALLLLALTRTLGILVTGVVIVLGASCAPEHPSSDGVTYRDSAGVRVVENHEPLWTKDTRWLVEDNPSVQLGANHTDPAQQLFRVGDVVPLTNRGVAVANLSADQILVFDSLGSFIKTIGQRGDGPGELRRVSGVYRCSNDTLVVGHSRRVSTFDAQGKFIRSKALVLNPATGTLSVQGTTPDCFKLLVRMRTEAMAGPWQRGRTPHVLFWETAVDAMRDTIASFPGREIVGAVVSGMRQALSLPWGGDAKWATDGSRVYLGFTERAEIFTFEASTLKQIIRWLPADRPISGVDHDLYETRRSRSIRRFPQVQELIPKLEEFGTLPASKPVFIGIIVDGERNIWLRQYPHDIAGRPDLYDHDAFLREDVPNDPAEVWTVFNSAGRLLGDVRVPGGLVLRSVYGGHIFAVAKDAMGVEQVAVYRLRNSR